MIINSKEGSRLSFPMKIPMDALGHLADEVEYQIRDFQISLEIAEIECMLAMYEDYRIHVGKILFSHKFSFPNGSLLEFETEVPQRLHPVEQE